MFDHRDLRELVCDQEQMRKRRGVFTSQPMKNLDWHLNFDATRDVKKCSERNKCLMQCCELGGPKLCGLRHEMFAEQIGVLNHCSLQRLENNSALFQLIRNDVALNQLVTGENHASRYLFEPARLLENNCVLLLS